MTDKKSVTLGQLADMVGGRIEGDPGIPISDLTEIESAGPGDITFLTSRSYLESLYKSRASAVIVNSQINDLPLAAIQVKDVNLASAIIHNFLLQSSFQPEGIDASARIGENCFLPSPVSIGPAVVLGDRVRLGERVVIGAGAVIGNDVELGSDTLIAANATVASDCIIGKRVRIHSGTVLGSDGFGYATDEQGRHIKRPQVGNVIIGDDVEIGANVCVDRATFGSTVIREGCKIDNLVQIAHNVEIGENSILVSQCGVAGSSKLGRNVVLAGRVAVSDHVVLGDRVVVGAMSGVSKDQKADARISGTPALPHKLWLKAITAFSRLPGLVKDIKDLKKRMAELEKIICNQRY
ncbi:MAG: UDP-3-O-(3-hydroxymyristoyl)glucosamine N-acyltransferase [Thermodesulfobacteriota bacterium]